MRPLFFLLIILLSASTSTLFGQAPPPPAPKKTTVRGNPARPPAPIAVPQNEVDAEGFFGALEENVYRNEFFGFEVAIPDDYRVLNNVEVEQYKKVASEQVQTDNDRNLKNYEKAVEHTSVLLGMVRNFSDVSDLIMLEIDVGRQPKGVTANMALLASSSVLTSTGKYKTERLLPDLKIGGRKFVGVLLSTDVLGRKLKIRLYAAVVRDYAFLVAVNYLDEKVTDELPELLDGIKFRTK